MGTAWEHFNVHDIVRLRANTRLPTVPPYFRVDALEPNFEVEMRESLPPPDRARVRRVVGYTAYEMGNRELFYETDTPIMFLLGSRARWRFVLGGLAEGTTRIVTAAPFFRFEPVRFKVTQLLSRLVLLVMTLKLIQKGFAMCHATSVARGDRATLLFGFSGTGKSTLASSLLDAGYEFLSDDYVIADPNGQVYCYPDWHKPRPLQVRIPLAKYVGLNPPYARTDLRIRKQAKVGPIFILERGPDRVADLDRAEALRRILLLNLEEVSKLWNSPLSGMLNHYAYFYPDLDLEGLMERYRTYVTSFVDRAERFVSVQSSSPSFEAVKDLVHRAYGEGEW